MGHGGCGWHFDMLQEQVTGRREAGELDICFGGKRNWFQKDKDGIHVCEGEVGNGTVRMLLQICLHLYVNWRRTHGVLWKISLNILRRWGWLVTDNVIAFYAAFTYIFPQTHIEFDDQTNYCRNVNSTSGDEASGKVSPWCYTRVESPVWEYCKIPTCGKCFVVNKLIN